MNGDPNAEAKAFVAAVAETAARLGIRLENITAEGATQVDRGSTSTLSFRSIHFEYDDAEPTKRAAILEHHLRALTEWVREEPDKEAQFVDVKSRLLPRVGAAVESPEPLATYPLVPGVLNAYTVVDFPRSMRYVREGEARTWGKTPEDLLSLAMSNLLARSSPSKFRLLDPRLPNLLIYEPEDQYESSRMLLIPQLLQPWPARGAVVACGAREMLLATPVNGPDVMSSIDPMIDFVYKIASTNPHPVSDQLFWHDGQYWHHLPVHRGGGKIGFAPPDRFLWAMMGLPREQWETGPPGRKIAR